MLVVVNDSVIAHILYTCDMILIPDCRCLCFEVDSAFQSFMGSKNVAALG